MTRNAAKIILFLVVLSISGSSAQNLCDHFLFLQHEEYRLISSPLANVSDLWHIRNVSAKIPESGTTLNIAGQVVSGDFQKLITIKKRQMFFTAFALAFGLFHIVLFAFYPATRSTLYFAILSFLLAALIAVDYETVLITGQSAAAVNYLRIHRLLVIVIVIFLLRFVYSIFARQLSWLFWLVTTAAVLAGSAAVINPVENLGFIHVATFLAFFESIRLVVLANMRKSEGAQYIGIGCIILFIFSLYDILLDFDLIAPLGNIYNGYPFGMIGLFFMISVYLASTFARIQRRTSEQEKIAREKEIEQRILEADNARKTQELEDARRLQLSMLPETLPQLNQCEIAVYMKTATEVGGDYYDFDETDDGSLTIAVGDATGHGIKAGILVALIKSVFNIMGASFYLPDFFNHCTKIIKQMKLGNLYMSLTLARITGYKMIASASGMPPILIYRAGTKTVDELVIKGMPLGAFLGFPYQQVKTSFSPGDTVLFMTDGFPELFNPQNEILDYPRAREIFQEIAHSAPDRIIEHLVDAANKWARGRQQDDDLTFVVLKFKENWQKTR